jgi:hypothetical protein
VEKLLPCDHEVMSWVQVLETASCGNEGKDCVHKTQSGLTLPRTLHKRELRASACPFFCLVKLFSKFYMSRSAPSPFAHWHCYLFLQLIIACSKGGTSIEDLAEKYPDMIIKV